MEKMDRETRSDLTLKPFPPMDELSGKELDRRARAAGETFVVDDRLKTHQLRNIFSAIEKIRSLFQQKENAEEQEKPNPKDLETSLILLKPKLAYAAGRQKSVRYHLFPFLENAIDSVVNTPEGDRRTKALRNFFALLESVVGYHKYFENQ